MTVEDPQVRWRSRRAGDYRPKKTAMLVAQRVVSEISDRGLAPGTQLPPERDMVEEYGIARGTLREALRYLEFQGVVAMQTGPGGGPVVQEPGSRHLARTIAMMLQLDGASFRAVLETRVTLEPLLAACAAERHTAEQGAALAASADRMEAHLDDVDVFLEENEAFHTIVAQSAANPVFSLVITSLAWICDGTPLGVQYSLDQRASVAREHQRIREAIASHDPARAAAAMSTHLGDFSTFLERYYPEIVKAPIRWDEVD